MAAGRASNNYHWPAGASGLLLTARPGAQSASCDHYARRSVEWSTKRGRSRGRCLSSQKAANKHAARSLARSANRMCVQERAIINSSASIGAQTFAGPQQLALLLRFFLSVFFFNKLSSRTPGTGQPSSKALERPTSAPRRQFRKLSHVWRRAGSEPAVRLCNRVNGIPALFCSPGGK